ncbi:MAG: preprotein translocase subunit SecE [Verrucomicrobiae bacterium]|nr:preprotein translocase subunit SecE [Verrucomicrobiae bacterium]
MIVSMTLMEWMRAHPVQTFMWLVFVVAAVVVFARFGGSIRSFLLETNAELAKCNWPVDPDKEGYARYQVLVNSTLVVVVAGLLLALYMFGVDFMISKAVRFILKIGSTTL